MSKSFLPMMATVAGAVMAYYLSTSILGSSETVGLFVGLITSMLLSGLLARLKK